MAVLSQETGFLIHHTGFRSGHLDNERQVIVYLPPGYDADKQRRYPVIYHLHGAGGNECKSLYSASVLHEGIWAGRWPEMIMVFPNGGRSTMYQDSGDGRFMGETNIVNELIRTVAGIPFFQSLSVILDELINE